MAITSTKPRIAVLEFKNKTDNQYWYQGGVEAIQDIFVTELVKSGKFSVIDREQFEALLREKDMSLSGDMDARTAVKAGKLLGVNYFLAGAITQYSREEVPSPSTGGRPGSSSDKLKVVATTNARLIDASTGEVKWADEAQVQDNSIKVSLVGFGGGVDEMRIFDKVIKPAIQQLAASLKAADL